MAEFGYDLLKIYYLCGSNNSLSTSKDAEQNVENITAFKPKVIWEKRHIMAWYDRIKAQYGYIMAWYGYFKTHNKTIYHVPDIAREHEKTMYNVV